MGRNSLISCNVIRKNIPHVHCCPLSSLLLQSFIYAPSICTLIPITTHTLSLPIPATHPVISTLHFICQSACNQSQSTILYLGQNKDVHSFILANSCWSVPMLSKESHILLIAILLIADSPHCYGILD